MKLFYLLLFLLLHVTWGYGQPAPDAGNPDAGKKPDVQISFRDQPSKILFGEKVQMTVKGELLKSITEEMAKSNAGVGKVVQFYFNGVLMPHLSSNLETKGQDQVLSLTIDRDANNADSRTAWDQVLRKLDNERFAHKISLSLGVAGRSPLYVGDLIVSVNSTLVIFVVILLCLIGFWGLLLWIIRRTNMLRDGDSNSAYSLGKTQMAFWGLVVFFSFAGVWATSGHMEWIPSQVLILLGISSGTGLAALAVGSSKQQEAEAALQKALAEQTNLQAVAVADQTPEQKLRLQALPTEITSHRANAAPAPTTKSFWKDLCTDANGMSFHRLQIILWTLILGAIFVQNVILTLSMPEFSETLLTLMGISNGTYLGFKIPEKQ